MPNALERTYYTDCDYALDNSSAVNNAKSTLWALKASLKKEILSANSAAVTAWTCEGSSDAVTAGIDGVDRWGSSFDATKLVFPSGAGARSWIVLKNAALGIWMLVDYGSAAQAYHCYVYLATSAFSGGSTTTSPTATNQIPAVDGTAFTVSTASAQKAHRVFDSEGYFIFGTSVNGSGTMHSVIALQKVTEVRTGDAKPWVFIHDLNSALSTQSLRGDNTSTTTSNPQWRGGSTHSACYAVNGTTKMTPVPAFWLGSGTTIWQGVTLTAADAGDGKFDDFPLYMVGIAGSTSVKGRLYDWRMTGGPANGSIYPAAVPSMTHLCIGHCWIPFTAVPTL